MKKRRIPSRAAALAVAFILAFTPLAACAGDGEPGQEPAPQAGEGETAPPGNGGEYGEPPGGNMPLGSPIAPASHINTITNIGDLEDEINEIIGDAEKKGTITLDVGTAETLFSTVAPNQITVDTEIWLTSRKPLTLTVTSDRHFGFDIDDGATLTLYLDNITLEGGSFKGGIQTTGRGALSLQRGTVIGCDYSTGGGNGGGGVYAANGNVEIGGNAVISDNTATSGGGVSAGNGVKISGNAIISDNIATFGGGVCANNGKVEIKESAIISGNEATLSNGGGVSAGSGVKISGNAVIADNEAFGEGGGVSAGGDVIISGNAKITGNKVTLGYEGGGVSAGGDVEINGSAEISNNEASNGGGVYAGNGNVEIGGNAVIADNVANNAGGVFAGGDVIISGNAEITGNTAKEGGGVLANGVVEIKESAKITGNEATIGRGGGVYTSSVTSGVKIKDKAIIYNNTANKGGGGVYVNMGNVEISGDAVIADNTADTGAGVYTTNKVEISGNAKITGNKASSGGGGVSAGGDVEINGSAEISNNEAGNVGGGGGGGGVFASGDVEIKDNAIITGNEVRNGAGGGIYARNNVKISGSAFINRNTTGYESRGGGVYAEGDVEINGSAEISNNEAGNGGGVYAEGKAEISGSAKITSNTAYYGGGIYTFIGYVEIRENAEIFGNKAIDDGGGVWANNANNITVTGGSFKGNLAGNGGYWITGADKASAPYKDWGGHSASAPFTHIANNFDIVYSTGLPPVHVAAFSMNDSAGTEFFRTVITAPGPLPDFPDDPSRDGFAFTGWNEEADGSGGRVTKNSIFNTTQRVYAQWEILPPKPPSSSSDDDSGNIAYVTVTFDSRGGSAVNRISVAVKGTLKLPAAPVREGYRFTGWYTDAALAKPFSPDTLITHSMTLYAGWELLEDIEPEPAVEEEPPQEAAWQNPFTDVHERDWFYGDVAYVYEHGLMTGVSQEQFSPAAPVTRGMAAAVLWRLGNCPAPAEPPAFADLSRRWYRDAVAWADESGIAAGYGPGIFGPEDDITREQLAVMLYNYARYAGVDANGQEDLSGYADHGEISGYALEAMAWASSKGYISGRSQKELAPKGTATRAEMAAILHRFKEDITKE